MAKKKTIKSKATPSKAIKKAQPKSAAKVKVTPKREVKKQTKTKKPVKKVAKKAPTKTTQKKRPVKSAAKSKTKPAPTKKGAKNKKSAKKLPSKLPSKKVGKKKANVGSKGYHRVKKYILDRYRKRTGVQTDADANKVAKLIYNWLKKEGKLKGKKEVTHKLLKEALDAIYPRSERRMGRKIVPEIPDRFQQPTEYYYIEDVIKAMNAGEFKNVWIYSPLILGKRNNAYIYLNPNQSYTYAETFQGWVDWINEQIRDGYLKEGSPPDMWFRFLDVFWHTAHKRWEVKIISCDVEGDSFNTGYFPDETEDSDTTEERFGINPDDEIAKKEAEEQAKKEEAEAKKKPEEPKPTPPPAGESKEVIEAKLKSEAELQKAYKIQTLMKGKQSIMEDIKFNKEIGEPIEDLMKKLKSIRDQIDKLLE